MIERAHNLPDDVIETTGRRVGIGASIVCIAFLSFLLWAGIYGCVSIVRGAL